MKVEIWSDVVCPWCYIGKRRFEHAVAEFPHEVEVTYRSFELDPSAPVGGGETTAASLARKYGGAERVAAMQEHVRRQAAEEGLTFRLDETLHANTVDAHRLLHLALDEGGPELQARTKEALMAEYFEAARDVSDPDVLRAVAVSSGLEPARVDAVLAGEDYREAVRADIAQAAAYGATGVPFFVLEGAYAVSGAQPTEVFRQVLDQVWGATRPTPVTVVGGAAGDVCGPEGCE
ncbi:MAG: DsbA family oxidoreductase [Nocardioides sp.]|nr:DsbA family oxidoreductase [Nocardioides sp.]